ncbi:hypothetical protein SDC9_141478 [bioreactor metagenome]|uniref:Uncharacterized protein n=1 Tax=bioreactor metagenome TaxID=1076179 RepID=A0A645E169_9ZZZZ
MGITGALENAAYDFAAKGVTSMLGNFVEEIAPKSGFAGNIKEVYNREKDEALAKPVTDAGEKVLETLMETLTGFLQKIRNGLA